MINRKVVPAGLPKPEHFTVTEQPVQELGDGEMLCRGEVLIALQGQ